MKNRQNYLFKNTIIFAISNFATKLISFLLIPLYTHKLTTSQYGTVDLLYTIATFLFPLFTLNISEAIFRFSMDKGANQKKISSIGLICSVFSIIFGIVVIPILNKFQLYQEHSIIFYFYLVSLSLCQISLAIAKGQEKLKLFATGNIINTLLTAFFSIFLILILDLSIIGYFLAYIISNTIVTAYILVKGKIINDLTKLEFDKFLFKNMIKYSTILIPTSFMWWIVNSSDRIMITKLISSAANGIYAVSYKIPSLLTVLASIFNQAWIFSAINEKNSKDYEKYTNEIFLKLFTVISTIAIALLAFIKPLMKILVSAEYYEAWHYTPFLIFGFVFMTLATFISTSYNVHKDSKGFLFSGICGALMNIVLNFIFIPKFNVYGAALATTISYIAVFFYRLIDTKKYVKINIRKSHYLLLLIFLIISCLTVYIQNKYIIILNIIEIIVVLIINKKIIKEFLGIIIKKIK